MSLPTGSEIGEAFFDHDARHFRRAPVARAAFQGHTTPTSIQILAYENVFPECLVFATLGVSLHPSAVGGSVEVVAVVDDGPVAVPRILANALFLGIDSRMRLRRGTSISGIASIDGEFAARFGKSGMYFTDCHALPESFVEVHAKDGQEIGRMLMGIFVSEGELQFLAQHRANAFEQALEDGDVDPFVLGRPTVQTVLPRN